MKAKNGLRRHIEMFNIKFNIFSDTGACLKSCFKDTSIDMFKMFCLKTHMGMFKI